MIRKLPELYNSVAGSLISPASSFFLIHTINAVMGTPMNSVSTLHAKKFCQNPCQESSSGKYSYSAVE